MHNRNLILSILVLSLLCCGLSGFVASKESDSKTTIAIVGATIYPSPTDPAISNGIVLIQRTKIVAVGSKDKIQLPKDAMILDCGGMFVTAGFQNSHVHFTEQKWENAATVPARQLNNQLQEMLTQYGFSTVVDTGSLLDNTVALRSRIESGELNGPRILTAGGPLYPVNGIPYYLKETLPPYVLPLLATPKTPEEAASIARARLDGGADIIKIFTGSWVKRGEVPEVLPMSVDIASAAVAEAHRRGKLAFTHPSNVAGLEVALQARVDVLAHALDDDRGWNASHISRMKANRMSMIPTLKLFSGHPYTKFIVKEVEDFYRAGGQILFGTDAGYMKDYDPTLEYELLSQAGMNWKAILAALTTAPAERFGETKQRGRISPGSDADIVVLAADPASDVHAFSKVRYTIRGGRILYTNNPAAD